MMHKENPQPAPANLLWFGGSVAANGKSSPTFSTTTNRGPGSGRPDMSEILTTEWPGVSSGRGYIRREWFGGSLDHKLFQTGCPLRKLAACGIDNGVWCFNREI